MLEIACGTGYWTQFIAPTARSVSGVDINEETLEVARSGQLPSSTVTFTLADVNALPPGYANFSGAFAGFWWSHVPRLDRRTFIDSLHKVLSPGAIVIALDNRYVEGSSTPISHTDADGNSYQRRRLADGSEHTVLKNFPEEAELVAEVSDYATQVEYIQLDYYWLLRYELAP